jgi:hypothetical protein
MLVGVGPLERLKAGEEPVDLLDGRFFGSGPRTPRPPGQRAWRGR